MRHLITRIPRTFAQLTRRAHSETLSFRYSRILARANLLLLDLTMSSSSEDESFQLSPTDDGKPDEEEAFLQEHKRDTEDEEVIVIRRPAKTLKPRLIIMMIANTLATIGIVSPPWVDKLSTNCN